MVALACLSSVVVLEPWATAPVAVADPATGPGVVNSTTAGATVNGTVPDGTCGARITAVGGGGASSTGAGGSGGRGGGAATVNAAFGVLPLQAYSGSVAGGGQPARTAGLNGGGAGGNAVTDHDGAGGGGRTVATVGGVALVVAGGGGGGGAAHNAAPTGHGGAGGSGLVAPGVSTGADGNNGADNPGTITVQGGRGGAAAAGGAGGTHSTTTALNGLAGGGTGTGTGGAGGPDPDYDAGGGGGGGYTGGGGGASTASTSVTGAGGGGGSSFVAATSPTVTAAAPSGISNTAAGLTAANTAGSNGSLNLDWTPCLYDLTLTKSANAASVNAGGVISWTVSVINNGPNAMTRGDTLTLLDSLPSGSNAAAPSPSNVVTGFTTTGGSNTDLTRGAITCTGISVGAAMPASTTCTRAYSTAAGTPGGVVSGGTRGLDVGERLTITYDQYISNTAACGSITNTATVVDRPTLNTTTATNHVGNQVTDTASGTVAINCYDLAITKTASPTPTVAQGGTITWTIAVTNLGPGNMVGPGATTPNPLIITDTFPTIGVGTPTLTGSTGAAGACTFSSPTITCPGSLNASQTQTLTFTQSVNAGAAVGSTISNTASVTDPRTGDTNDSSTASTQVSAAPRITLQKVLSQPRFSNTDQFVMSIAGTGGTTATTAGTGSTVTGGVATVATAAPGQVYTLSESMAAGSASTIGQYAGSISCTNAAGGSSTVLPSGSGTSFALTPQAGDNITCTFSNTLQPTQVSIAKTTSGGVGTFGFGMTNLSAATTNVTTTAIGTPVTSTAFSVTNRTTNVVLTETVPTGWRITGATCSDLNAAVTGNAGTFGTLASNVLTVPSAMLEPGANIVCTFTNEKLARLVIQKTAQGGGGTFGYTTTGGLTPSTFNLVPNPPTTPSVTQVFDNLIPGTYTVTEGAAAVFQLTDLTCVAAGTSAPGSTVTPNLGTRTVTANLAAGGDYTCTFTNVRDAQMTVTKTSIGGDNTFTFTTTGSGTVPDPAPSITTTSGVGSSTFQIPFPTGTPTRNVTITENTPPAGWVLTGIACTNGSGASVGTVTLPSVTVAAAPGETFNCNFTNQRLPRVTILKQSVGTTGTFSFTGGTNGLPASLSLDTTAANPATSSVYQLAAFNTATSITETVPTNYTLTSVTCVDGSGSTIATTLVGSTLTIPAAAIVGGANITCTFVNTRQSAQVRVDKRWLGAIVGNQVTVTSTGGTNNPSLVSVADTPNEVDAGTAVTVFSGETLNFSEVFDIGTASNYDVSLACTGATDTTPGDGLTIAPGDNGASIVCTYTNSRIANVTKSAGSVTGPNAAGIYTANYTVVVDNPGGATTYGALVDTPAFAGNLEVTGASWTATASSGAAPLNGSGTGTGPFTLAPAGQAVAAQATHTYSVAVTFRFLTYVSASACAGSGTGLYNSVSVATPELQTTDNSACIAPPAPPAPAISIAKSANPTTVTAANQTINYSFLVTNTGNVNLTSVVVNDPLPALSAISCPGTSLAPAASMTCTASYLASQADIDAGQVVNTASATGTAPNGSTVNASDGATVTATRTPAISIAKSANPMTVTAANQTINYSFLVTNTGNVTLTAVGVTDALPGISAVSCPQSTLAPAGSMTCTANYTTSQADIDAGQIVNTATASGTPPAGVAGPVTATDSETVTATRTATIDLQKTSNPTSVAAANQTINYSFLVTNTGNVTLTAITLSDPMPNLSSISCPASTLAPGATTTCTATYITTQADVDSGSIVNVAGVSATPPAGMTGPITDTDPNTVSVSQAPSITLVKSANPTTVTAANQTVNYSLLVTNNGNVTLTNVSVSDTLPGLSVVSCPGTTLLPGADMTCTASYSVQQADIDAGSIVNAATAQGLPPIGGAVTDTDSVTVTAVRTPAIAIVKTANPTTVTAANQTITYSFQVTNTGNVSLDGVSVTDPLPGLSGITCPATSLAPAASMTCSATYSTSQANIDAGSVVNTAQASGNPRGGGAAVNASDGETVAATRTPSILLDKSVSPTSVTTAPTAATYTFVVTNTGNVTLTSIGIVDPLPTLGAISCPGTTLAPAASMTCTAAFTVTQAHVDAGGVNNTATVTGTPPAGVPGTVSHSDSASIAATRTPGIDLDKSASPNNITAANQTITYSFMVTNTGNVTLTGVAVTDPHVDLSAIVCPGSSLAPGAAMTCTATYVSKQSDVDSGSIPNIAGVSATPPAGVAGPVTDTDAETVTASRTPSIQIVKSSSPTSVNAANQLVTYSFVVTNTGNVTLSGIAVSDPLAGLGPISCPASGLAPAASMTCTASYTTTQADINAGQVDNTASVTGNPPVGAPVSDTDTHTLPATRVPDINLSKSVAPSSLAAANQVVTYSFLVTNTGNVTLTGVGVSDSLAGLTPVTCPSTTLQPGGSTTCTATKSVTQAEFDAGSLLNTATASGVPPMGGSVSDVDTATLTFVAQPGVTIDKTVNPTTLATSNQTVTYTFRVTNTGNVTLNGITVTDPLPGLGAISCPGASLVPAAAMNCTASKLVNQTEFDAGVLLNTVTVNATPPSGPGVSDTDGATVTMPAAPVINVVKTATPNNVTAANQPVSYQFLVANTGNVTLTAITVTDPLVGLTTPVCPATTLAPGEDMVCTASYTTTVADMNLGYIDNTVAVSGQPPSGPRVADTDDEQVTASAAPAIQVQKAANPTVVNAASQTINYTFLVTNTGNVTLTGVAVNDLLPGLSAVTCPQTTLAPGLSTLCTATYTTTQADIDAGGVHNTAIAEGLPPIGGVVTDTSSADVTATQNPAITLVKSATPTSVAAAGDDVTYSFLVTNTGNVTLDNLVVSDPMPGLSAIVCPASTLAPGAATTCTATYEATQSDVDNASIVNTASVTATPPTGPAVTDGDTETVMAPADPAISLTKTANPATVTAAGQTIVYSLTVSNTGNVTLTGIDVVDPMPNLSAIVCPVDQLAPGTSTTCTATYVTTQADIDAGQIDNAATVTGTPPSGPTVTDGDTTTVPATAAPAIELVKSATPNNVTAAGQTVDYSFLVRNTGNVTLTGVAVTDPLPGLSPISCPVTTLAPNDTTTCTASYIVQLADVNAGRIDNTATAAGTPPSGPAVSDADSETVTAASTPSIQIVKSATPLTVTAANQPIGYSFDVINTGNVTLTGVVVSDPLPGLSAISCPATTLAPTDSMTCTATFTTSQANIDSGQIDNTATVRGTPPTGPLVNDTDSVSVVATRTPAIGLVKTANPSIVTTNNQLITYSFAVTNTGNVTLTGVGVFDPLPGLSGIACPATLLAPGATTTCTATYTTTQADIDAGQIDNTATVSGTPPSGPAVTAIDSAAVTAPATPSIAIDKTVTPTTVTTAGQTVDYTMVVTNTGNVTLSGVNVFDPLPGLSAVSCPASQLAPATSTTCTASKVITQADVDAGQVDNTATVSGTPPVGGPVSDTDDASVSVPANPSIALDKSATPNNVIAAGQTVTYSFDVRNTGNVTLSGVVITDALPGLGAINCPASVLAPAASTTCTASYTVSPADMNAGSIANTASVSGTPPIGAPVSDSDSETVTAVAAPAIQVVKTANPTTVTAANQTVNYTFLVTNTGNVSLTGIVVTDPRPGMTAVTCPGTALAIGSSMTCTASYTTTLADINAGGYTNTASVAGLPPTGPAVNDSDSESVLASQLPSISLVKSSNPLTATAAGQTITYSFLITNTGNVSVTGVAVNDPLPGLSPVVCPATALDPAQSTTCTATLTTSQTHIDAGAIDNTATATATPPAGGTVAATDSHTVGVPVTPSIGLVKSALPASVTSAGQLVNYSFVVTNTGNVTLTGVGVADPLPGLSAVVCPVSTLTPAASTTCTATYVTTQADVDSGVVRNIATASGTPPSGPAVTGTSTVDVIAPPAPSIVVDKTASPGTVGIAGQVITYSFLVTNAGNVTLSNVGVTDPMPGLSAVNCALSTLAPSQSTTCSAAYTTTQSDIDAGSIVNTATAAGTPPTGAPVTDTDTNIVPVASAPAIDLVKSATPTAVTVLGETIDYSFAVTNVGNVTLTAVTVLDPLPGLSTVGCAVSSLAPGATTTCTATYSVTQADLDAGTIVNTATATGTPLTGPAVTDSSTATVLADPVDSMTFEKTASPATVAAAGATVTYTFVVNNTGDSTLTSVTVVDPLPGLSSITCPATSIAPGAQLTCTASYVATQADVDAGTIVNTATVTATPGSAAPLTASDGAVVVVDQRPALTLVKSASPTSVSGAGALVQFTFRATNSGNVTLTGVSIVDPMPGVSALDCATFSGVLAPGESATCTARYTVTQADVNAGTIRNTATASGTALIGGATVESSSAVTVAVAQTPGIRIVKSVSAASVSSGTTVTYTFAVSNTGNIALSGVAVADPLPGLSAISCPGFTGSLAVGQSISCSATYRANSSAATNGRISNTASVTGRAPDGTLVANQSTVLLTVTSPTTGGGGGGGGGGTVASTGSDVAPLIATALSLLLLGGMLLLLGRRRHGVKAS